MVQIYNPYICKSFTHVNNFKQTSLSSENLLNLEFSYLYTLNSGNLCVILKSCMSECYDEEGHLLLAI